MILHRIKQFIDFRGMSIAAFERSIGVSNASFAKSLKSGGTIGVDKLEKLLNVYPELNPVWLLTGEGEMLNTSSSSSSSSSAVKASVKLEDDAPCVHGSDMYERFISLLEKKDEQIDRLLSLLERLR